MAKKNWMAWHEPYDEPGSSLHRRLQVVQGRISDAFDAARPGPIRIVSVCAGQGRDIIGAAETHRRGRDLVGRLVELDPRNVKVARDRVATAGLADVEVIVGDGSTTTAYEGCVPADLVLVCGVFGNVSDADIRNTIRALPMFCRPGATLIWTRHRLVPDLTPAISRWFADSGFDEIAFDAAGPFSFAVGTNRFRGASLPYRAGVHLFDFLQ